MRGAHFLYGGQGALAFDPRLGGTLGIAAETMFREEEKEEPEAPYAEGWRPASVETVRVKEEGRLGREATGHQLWLLL